MAEHAVPRAGVDDLAQRYQVAPIGVRYPLFRWLEYAGPAVDITELRRRYPHIGWHTFADWAATQDWHRLAGTQP